MNLTPRCYIWVIAIFLFSCILSGGTFLVLYMVSQPETPTTSWYPIIGIVLVCLPWFFWVLTVLYRILSRTLGFRMVCWGQGVFPLNSTRRGDAAPADANNGDGSALEDGNTNDNNINNAAATAMGSSNSKQVHFGDSVAPGGSSKASHDSQLPLTSSMAS
ncbi:Stress response protein NST1 [Bienertia sinuspersici]